MAELLFGGPDRPPRYLRDFLESCIAAVPAGGTIDFATYYFRDRALAQALIDACVETLGLRSDRLVVEFTQHTSDEMYRAGRGWAAEWTPAEATGAA